MKTISAYTITLKGLAAGFSHRIVLNILVRFFSMKSEEIFVFEFKLLSVLSYCYCFYSPVPNLDFCAIVSRCQLKVVDKFLFRINFGTMTFKM